MTYQTTEETIYTVNYKQAKWWWQLFVHLREFWGHVQPCIPHLRKQHTEEFIYNISYRKQNTEVFPYYANFDVPKY